MASGRVALADARGDPARSADPLTVVYIMGAPRSGSTILDILLGSHPDVVSTGELGRLPDAGWMRDEYCACGARTKECVFWKDVRQRWIEQVGHDDVEGFLAGQGRFTAPVRLRPVPPWLAAEIAHPSREFARFIEETKALFRAVASASGARFVVDSSKPPGRALALSAVPGVRLKIIHLVRDGRGVAWSLAQSFARDERSGIQRDIPARRTWRTAWDWRQVNRAADAVLRHMGDDGIRLRYEDLVARPAEALGRIGALFDLDYSCVIEAIRRGQALQRGHLVAGNRLRMAESLRLVADERWRADMPARDRSIFWTIAGGVARRYGYARG